MATYNMMNSVEGNITNYKLRLYQDKMDISQ